MMRSRYWGQPDVAVVRWGEVMKRTPVLIDVNGVPLRESLSYNGSGAGFGGQMAEWLPPAQSADAALLPALRLGMPGR